MTPQRRDYPLSLSEAARALGVSKAKAYEMAASGDLPTHRDDVGRLRVHPADLKLFLDARAAEDAAQPTLFTQEPPRPRTRALRRRQARVAHRSHGEAWLAAVGSEAWVGDEECQVLEYLAAHSNDDGTLDDEASALVHHYLGGA